jgi:uncharacterized membrane protein SpoIIM required for sporulation
MAELQLKSHRFRTEREASWRRLESLLTRTERRSVDSLTDEELLEVPVLYRSAMSSLSVARSISLDQGAAAYLESLCLRAYLFVYGVRSTPLERLGRFFTHDWPAAVRSLWRDTLVSFALFLLGALVAYVLASQDPDWFYALMPDGMAQGRDPATSTAALRQTLYHDEAPTGLAGFATYLFIHNAQIAIFAFALGFAFCLPTALLLIYNGLTMGTFMALFVSRGLGMEVSGWLLIHGVTEIFAVTLAGAAGLRIGRAIIAPGDRPRVEAAAEAGRSAALAMAGVVFMLMVAGLLEGFGRQLITNDIARFAVAAATAVLWGGYFYLPRRRAA